MSANVPSLGERLPPDRSLASPPHPLLAGTLIRGDGQETKILPPEVSCLQFRVLTAFHPRCSRPQFRRQASQSRVLFRHSSGFGLFDGSCFRTVPASYAGHPCSSKGRTQKAFCTAPFPSDESRLWLASFGSRPPLGWFTAWAKPCRNILANETDRLRSHTPRRFFHPPFASSETILILSNHLLHIKFRPIPHHVESRLREFARQRFVGDHSH